MCSMSTQWAYTVMTSCAILCTFHSWTPKFSCICLSESTGNINIKCTCLKDRMTSVGFKPAILHIQCLNKGIDRHSQDAPEITHSTSHAIGGTFFFTLWSLVSQYPSSTVHTPMGKHTGSSWYMQKMIESSCHQTFSCSLWHKDGKLNTKASPGPFVYFLSILHHENSPMV